MEFCFFLLKFPAMNEITVFSVHFYSNRNIYETRTKICDGQQVTKIVCYSGRFGTVFHNIFNVHWIGHQCIYSVLFGTIETRALYICHRYVVREIARRINCTFFCLFVQRFHIKKDHLVFNDENSSNRVVLQISICRQVKKNYNSIQCSLPVFHSMTKGHCHFP